MLLESPNPKDPQDAEVAAMLTHNPERFAVVARDWAVRHAGATKQDIDLDKWIKKNVKEAAPKPDDTDRYVSSSGRPGRRQTLKRADLTRRRYKGYSKDLVDRFVNMGFDVESVVDAFVFVRIDHNDGQDYELEEAYMGDITARLLGEQ